MPPTTIGPGAPIDPPLAATPFAVGYSRTVLYSQMRRPSSVENARSIPSHAPENTTPGKEVVAADWPGRDGSPGVFAGVKGVNHLRSPVARPSATTPPTWLSP